MEACPRAKEMAEKLKKKHEAEILTTWLVWLEDWLNTGETEHVSKYFEAREGIYKYRKQECLKIFRSVC